ncbi:hypothetical protein [Mycobacterium sp. C31M]
MDRRLEQFDGVKTVAGDQMVTRADGVPAGDPILDLSSHRRWPKRVVDADLVGELL